MNGAASAWRSRLAIVGALLVVLSVWTHARPHAADAPAPAFGTLVPLVFDSWIGRDAPPLSPESARILAADRYLHRYYGPRRSVRGPGVEPGTRVEMDIAYYARPQAGATMHSPLNCLPGNGWRVVESRPMSIAAERADVTVRRLVVARGNDRVAMTYWFQNRGAVVASEPRQRLQLLTNGLHGRPTDGALVRVMSHDTPAGHAALTGFTREMLSLLSGTFR